MQRNSKMSSSSLIDSAFKGTQVHGLTSNDSTTSTFFTMRGSPGENVRASMCKYGTINPYLRKAR